MISPFFDGGDIYPIYNFFKQTQLNVGLDRESA